MKVHFVIAAVGQGVPCAPLGTVESGRTQLDLTPGGTGESSIYLGIPPQVDEGFPLTTPPHTHTFPVLQTMSSG